MTKLFTPQQHPDPSTTHVHLMGVGGIGVSAFARLLLARGYLVSGCDAQRSELTAQLEGEGVSFCEGHSAAHISAGEACGRVDWPVPSVLVASEAVPKTHPEVAAAHAAGLAVLPRMRLLAELLESGPSVGVVGTHGKTTTSAMIAVAMAGAGLDPSAFVGGHVPEFGANARAGTGPFVAEVDESDRNFAALRCQTAVLTNAEDDHIGGNQATYWESVEQQHAAFAQFVRQAEQVLYCADWIDSHGVTLAPLVQGCAATLSYGTLEGCDYRAADIHTDPYGTSFMVWNRERRLGEARVSLPGKHNMLNALAALAVCDLYGGDFAPAAAALSQFRGPGRRWQIMGELPSGAVVVDDYAHNPTKLAAAVQAAHQTGRRVRVVFQPHRYLRTQQSWKRLADALMQADEVLVLDIAAAREEPLEGIHATLISGRMSEQGHAAVRYAPSRGEALAYLQSSATSNDIIVTMGAGDVWELAQDLVGAPPAADTATPPNTFLQEAK